MFKKTFLAVAVGAALGSTGANAVDFAFDVNDWTDEGAERVTDFAVPDITVTLGKEYTPNDVITMTYDKVVDGDFPLTINVDDGLVPSAPGAFTMTLGLLSEDRDSTDSTSVTYRVTEITSTGSGDATAISTTGAQFVLGAAAGSDLTTASAPVIAADGMMMDFMAETQVGQLVELESGMTETLVSFTEQYHSITAESEFDNVIDVERGIGEDYNNIGTDSQYIYSTGGISGEDYGDNVEGLPWDYENDATRAIFTTGNGDDYATLNVSEIDGATHDALAVGLTLKVTGPFGFIIDEDEDTEGVQNNALQANMPSALPGERIQEATWDGNTATFMWDNGGSDVTDLALGDIGVWFTNDFNGDDTEPMDRGTFTAEATIVYEPVESDYIAEDGSQTYDEDVTNMTSESTDMGEWTMDGSKVTVYAVPFQPGVSVFLWITNQNMEEDTPVMITATDANGMVTDLGEVATLSPNGITRISSDLNDALTAAGVATGRVTLEITTSAPACDVNVAASYKVQGDADRLPLETSQTINGVHNTGNSGLNNDLCIL